MKEIKSLVLFVFFIILSNQMIGQVGLKYSKAKINLIGRDINDLAKAGIEIDHGIYVKNRYFISDFSANEIQVVRNLKFDVDVLIDDVNTYYAQSNRASEIINTQSKRNNCDGIIGKEYDYQTPTQYEDGSMGGYFTYQEMLDILDTMASRYPNLISQRSHIEGFTTYNGQQIQYVKVSDQVTEDDNTKPNVLYTALHHAREPNSLSQMIFYLWYLLENYGTDDIVTKIVNETALYFLPCVNPDGYILNENANPKGGGLWRKNTWKDTTGNLKGVDLNRNYGFFWGTDDLGSSNNPNSEVYRGQNAFSEPETQAVRQFCLDHNFKISQNYHTFGNYLIHPWGYNDLPTDEDDLFKAMGSVMNKENNFTIGTGTETVGYVTNGDSDDWMYGEQAEKNKIYSYTPEVGPSFWPPKIDIDYLNKSCVWMNISTALLTLNYYFAEDATLSSYLNPEFSNIDIKVARAGLKDGFCTVSLMSNTSGVNVLGSAIKISLPTGQVVTKTFNLDIDNSLEYPDGISLTLITENDGIIEESNIQKQWFNAPLKQVYGNNFLDSTTYNSDSWATTDKIFISGPTSITDSPDGEYPANLTSFFNLNQPIDLSNSEEAFLNFYAKWEIENDYDFVQVQASKDNLDFIPLCGNWTNPGTRDQDFSSPLYDGIQNEWVLESIDLKSFVGQSKVWIRFKMVTDEYVNLDGFYLDDLEVVTISQPNQTKEQNHEGVIVFPNITNGVETVNIKGAADLPNGKIYITDQFGQRLGQFDLHPTIQLSELPLSSGIYFYRIDVDGKNIANGKLVIMN